ncbi:MAG TPA: sulfite exporter TauE/SafE family protein [Beijerinckiaceae bacterium]|nr:sulfite exporter TauE/SafE family protein [Beijerinckiaceae bacterium]
MAPADILLPALLFGSAALYTSVGHAGASAYLASMALVGLAPETMRPTALVLNICVASFSAIRFWRAGLVDARLAAWLLAGAAPLAFLGGAIKLPGEIYRPLVGVLLIVAAIRLLLPLEVATNRDPKPPPPALAALTGAAIGLLSGLTGTGGGIFLSPILIFCGWAATRNASGIAITFILCNSVFGLLGNLALVQRLPSALPIYLAAAMAGALVGTALGVKRLPSGMILKALGAVLVIAGLKLIFT